MNAHGHGGCYLALLLAGLAAFCRAEPVQKPAKPCELVCFADAPGGRVKQPLYALGPEGKLYLVPTDQLAEHFWGPAWQKNVNWWGDKNGRPQGAHLADFMKPKGPAISAATTWLAPFVKKDQNVGGLGVAGAQREKDDFGPYEIDVGFTRLNASNGRVVEDEAFLAATEKMTREEKEKFRVKADLEAQRTEAAKQNQRNWERSLTGVSDQELKAKYKETTKAIAAFEAALGRKSHLTAFIDRPGVASMIYVGGTLHIAVRNGVIDRAEYEAIRRSAGILEKDRRRMQKLGY